MTNNKSFSNVVVKSPLNIVIGAIATPNKAITWFQKQGQLLIPISNYGTQVLTLQIKAD